LIALQLGAFEARGADDDAPMRADLPGHLVALLTRVAEELLQHRDHVLEAMVVVVEQDHVVGRLPARLLFQNRLGHFGGHGAHDAPLSSVVRGPWSVGAKARWACPGARGWGSA